MQRTSILGRRRTSWLIASRVRIRRISSKDQVVQEGDVILLRRTDNPDAAVILSKPLKTGDRTESHRGVFPHDDIIGKRVRDIVTSSAGRDARIHLPTLAEYVTLTPRLVTPVYPGEANLIVSLLDIHATSGPNDEPPFEILEAGTGHGALTLHLARAVHAANALGHSTQRPSHDSLDTTKATGNHHDNLQTATPPARRAIVHTIDINTAHSVHAKKIVTGFRNGLYAGNVEFHTGNVSDFIHTQLLQRQTAAPFLACAVLDLPATHKHLPIVSSAMTIDATLAVFCPNITQIAKCIETCKDANIPLFLEQVVELGANASGGRQWDVRFVKPKTPKPTNATALETTPDGAAVAGDQPAFMAGSPPQQRDPSVMSDWELVCRPKLGDRITGGGFLGVWKKTRQSTQQTGLADTSLTERPSESETVESTC